ncbi:MAG TPA: tripartite tricarboxylate transporter substrate-binding protein [Pseudolabrys sp.]|nr:tripartite tricarboxylate transporter substrate-binding protein [Pseudolabrys sp.]
MTKISFAVALLATSIVAFPAASEENYPTRSVTMIVPFAAGGSSDVIARLIADQMSNDLGQRIVIENVTGAGGSIAMARAAKATPDGYTISIGNSGTNTAVYTLYPDAKFTPDDFMPIGLVAKSSPIIAVKKDFPAQNLLEFIAYAKKNPGKVTLGHAGIGSSNYLICKTFVRAAKIEVTLVGYRGGGPALNDLMGGQIDGVCDSAASVSSAIHAGRARGLAVSLNARLPSLADIPTSAEAGLPEFQLQGWNSLFTPKGTPQAVIDRLNASIRKGVTNEKYLKLLGDLGSIPPTNEEMKPEYVRQFVSQEIAKFRDLLGADRGEK